MLIVLPLTPMYVIDPGSKLGYLLVLTNEADFVGLGIYPDHERIRPVLVSPL